MSLPTEMRSAQLRALRASAARAPRREVDAGEQELPDRRDGRPVPDETGLLDLLIEELLEQAEAAVDADVVWRASAGRGERAHVAIRPDEREVRFELPPSTASTIGAALTRSPASGGEQALDELLVDGVLADERVSEQALGASAGSPLTAARGEALVRRNVLGQPEQPGQGGCCGSGTMRPALDACRQLDDVVVGEAGQGAVVADVDLVDDTSPETSDETSLSRRLAVERAAALLEQRRLLVQVRTAVISEAALDLATTSGGGAASSCSARSHRGGSSTEGTRKGRCRAQ